MTVWFESPEGGGLAPCELVSIDDSGAALRGGGWELRGYQGALYDAEGAPLSADELRQGLRRERAGAIWEDLREAGYLDDIHAALRLQERLLDALATVPLLAGVIARLREEHQG